MRVGAYQPGVAAVDRTHAADGTTAKNGELLRGKATTEEPRTPESRSRQPERFTQSARRYADLSAQLNINGQQGDLPQRSQLALEAYINPEREEEKRYLHDAMGIDTYA